MVDKKGLFFKAKSKRLARDVTIVSPAGFRRSIKKLVNGGLSLKERRALILAQNRATAQLKRKNLSGKERKQFSQISQIRIPKVTKKK